MAIQRKPAASEPAATAVPDERDVMITTLTRVLNRLIIQMAPGSGAATFRQLATGALHVASHAEIDVIEAWLIAHHGS